MANRAAAELGRQRWANTTAEERAEHARMMNARRWGRKRKQCTFHEGGPGEAGRGAPESSGQDPEEAEGEAMTVTLYYPPSKYGGPIRGRAIGKARLTKSQIIVESAEVIEGKIGFHPSVRRYRRDNLRPIPWVAGYGYGWQLDSASVDTVRSKPSESEQRNSK